MHPNVLPYVLLSSKLFHHDARCKSFNVDASSLNRPLGRVYRDACDEGFGMVSAKTGKIAVFVHIMSEKDHEGEPMVEIYRLVPEYAKSFPHLKDYTVNIFND